MALITKSYRFSADRYYPWLLLAVSVTALWVTWWQAAADFQSPFDSTRGHWSVKDYLSSVLSVVALMTLIWRICFAMRYRAFPSVSDGRLPKLTVVIPAFNEGSQVMLTVRSVARSRYPARKLQIICVDDGSQDDTWQWMEKAQAELPGRVQLIRQPFNQGKRHALMAGFAQARGDVFVTIDSDSEVLPHTLRHLVSPMVSDQRVGAVAGNVRVLNIADGAIPKMMEVSFTSAFDFIRSGQSVYGGVFCTPGALSAFRAAVIKPCLADWAGQRFMGVPASIGDQTSMISSSFAFSISSIFFS